MTSRRSQFLLCLILILGGSWPFARTGAAQDALTIPDLSAVTLSPNDCSFLIQGEADPRPQLGSITCGTLDVPENWSQPEGRRIQISYAVLEATSAQPMPDPIIFLAGGPGTSPLTHVEAWSAVFAGLRQERDVVIFDQRGTRLSSPLRCEAQSVMLGLDLPPEVVEAALGGTPVPPAYPPEVDPEELLQSARETYSSAAADCVRQLIETGVDLSKYNSLANASDVVALVKALGYDVYNLYGVSYGTRLALEVMRSHADSGLRSVVLDSTYPPEVKSYEEFPQEPHEVVIQLFADCALDPTCHSAYPDLKARFIALLERLRSEPVAADDGTTITDRDLIEVMQGLGANIRAVPYVPLMIAELEMGMSDTFVGIASGSLFEPTDGPATPEAESELVATPTTGDLSLARQFVVDLQRWFASLPEHEASQLLQSLMNLDTLAHDRQTLRDFIQRAIPEAERAEIRATFLAAVDAMSEADVQEVFVVVEQMITLDDVRMVGVSVPQYYSIECNERIPFQSFANMVTNAQELEIPELALGVPESFAKVFAICEEWPSGQALAIAEQPVWSDVPTLILAGAYDNLTPVSWNKSAFRTLPNGNFVLAPMSGHGVITFSACADAIAQAFLANPAEAPDTGCLVDLKPAWVMPSG